MHEDEELFVILGGIFLAGLVISDRDHPASVPSAIAIVFGVIVVAPLWRRVDVDFPWYLDLNILAMTCYYIWRGCSFYFDRHRVARWAMLKQPKYEDALECYDRRNYAGALAKFEQWGNAGDAVAQYNIGVLHETGCLGRSDDASAERWYRAAAAQGLAVAQFEPSKILVSDLDGRFRPSARR